MVNTHRYNWCKQNLYSHYPCCLLITRNNSLVYIFTFHSSRTQASDKLPWNSIQRNSSHSKITESSLLHLLKIVHEILISIELWVCFLSWFSYKTLPRPGRQQRPQQQEIRFLARTLHIQGFVEVLEAVVVTVLNTNILPDWWNKRSVKSSMLFKNLTGFWDQIV